MPWLFRFAVAALLGALALGCGGDRDRIAWIGPASTPSGEQAVRGIRVYLEHSRSGLELDVYDDADDPARARALAEEIASSPAVAVIGHHSTECATVGAAVYRDRGIPYITAYATHPAVTLQNSWAFRALPTDLLTARTLAHYVATGWPDETVSFVGRDDEAAAFGDAWRDARQGTVVRPNDADGVSLDHPIVITLPSKPAAELLRRLRARGFSRPVLLNRAATTPAFFAALGDVALANGVHIAATYNFDIADKNGGRFRRDYQDRFDDLPTWEAALSSDAAAVIAQTLPSVAQGGLKARREALRVALQNTSGVRATTGVVWFNDDGDRGEPLALGVMRNGKIETALVQLYPDAAGRTFTEADVVLTGVRALEFTEVDLEGGTFTAQFHLWFRHRPNVNLDNLVLLNAAEPVSFDKPDHEVQGDGWRYRHYRLQVKLQADHFAGNYGEHVLGVSYRHDRLTRDRVFFARDSIGMGVRTAKTDAERLRELERLVDPDTGYAVSRVMFYEDGFFDHSLGNPEYLDRVDKTIQYSRYNIGVIVSPRQLTPRRSFSARIGRWAASISALFLVVAFLLGRRARAVGRRWLFATQIVGAMSLLVAAEVLIGDYLLTETGRGHLRGARLFFDAAWWFVPAMLLSTATARFVWEPLEASSGRGVPTILKHFVSFTIYLLALFGIIAFVFDQKLTSLLATSGVFAMIIGLAIQINITNIFSGIALNLERPFKVGDWIMIHGRTPDPSASITGCVVDINWRTTRLKTTARSIVVIPNGVISEKIITNFMSPSEVSRFELVFAVDSAEPSERVLATIEQAVAAGAGQGLLEDPPFKVRIDGSSSDGVLYSVRYFIVPRELSPSKARHLVTESVLASLQQAGITLAQNPRDLRYRPVDGPPFDAADLSEV